MTYAISGVDRAERRRAKKFGALEKTLAVGAVRTPFNTLYPSGRGAYSVLTVDGVGTKILLAELAGIHEGIGVDGVAMVVNDCVRCGARPVAVADIIDVHHSEPNLLGNLFNGIARGAKEAGCAVVGGETADVPAMISGVGGNPVRSSVSRRSWTAFGA